MKTTESTLIRGSKPRRMIAIAAVMAAPILAAPSADAKADKHKDNGGIFAAAAKAIDGKGNGPQPRLDARPADAAPELVRPVAGPVDYGDEIAAFGTARGRMHDGQDVFAKAGTPLVAPSDGVVIETGTDGGRGNYASVYSPERKQTYNFFHMIEAAEVKAGQKLDAGDRIGEVGCTGSCWGDHLHFEIRLGKDPYGEAIDPMPFLEKAEPIKK